MGYLQCGATLIRAWNNVAIFHILSVSVWRGCGIRVMSIIWERNGRRRVHDLSQTRKLGCFLFSPVCNLLVMLNTPGKQKQNAKLFGNSSSLSPLAGGGGREGVINIKQNIWTEITLGIFPYGGKETCCYLFWTHYYS